MLSMPKPSFAKPSRLTPTTRRPMPVWRARMEQTGDALRPVRGANLGALQPNVDAYLVLARLNLKQNQLELPRTRSRTR